MSKQFRNTSNFIAFASKISAIPFKLKDKKEQQELPFNLLMCTSKRNHKIWLIFSCLNCIHPFYLWTMLYIYYKTYLDENDYTSLALHVAVAYGQTIALIIRALEFTKWKVVVNSTNQLLNSVGRIISKNPSSLEKYAKRWKILDNIMLLAHPCVWFGTICLSSFVLIFPSERIYWFLQFVPEIYWKQNYLVLVIFFVYEMVTILSSWTAYFVETFLLIFYIDTLAYTLRIVKREKFDRKTYKIYQELQLLTTIFHDAFGNIFGLSGMKSICTFSSLTFCSLAIILIGKIYFLIIVFFLSGATSCLMLVGAILPTAGNIYLRSKQFSKLPAVNDQVLIKQKPSCKPISIKTGNLYILQKHTVLNYFNLFLSNLGGILIGLQFIRSST